MDSLFFDEIVKCLGGKSINYKEDLIISGVSTDSRKIKKGDLFIALKGENFDGNEFVNECFKKGAKAAVISKNISCDGPAVLVDDGLIALKKLSELYKKKFDIPIIAVTGSSGKTSTKEIISSVLAQKYRVHKTYENLNNEIGLPLTLFELNHGHEISVLEMGMNSLGEIKRLVSIAKPDIGIITNVGTAHIENLKKRENILKAKMEITTYFNSKNILLLNGDDEYLSSVKNKDYKIIRVSTKGNGEYNATDIKNLGEEGVEFKCNYRGEEHVFRIGLPGMHNVYNGLFAIALGDVYGLKPNQIKEGLIKFNPGSNRMDIINLSSDIKIINDCYNANLDSMKAAIDVLYSFKNSRKIAVLGDMFELGDFSDEAHKELGRYASERVSMLIAIGKEAKNIYNEAHDKIESRHFDTKDEACRFLKSVIMPKDAILIKASRGMGLEYIVNYLTNELGDRKVN